MKIEPILINGQWRASTGSESFNAWSPTSGEALTARFPISPQAELEEMVEHAVCAWQQLSWGDEAKIAAFLRRYAALIESSAAEICELAHLETGLAISPRLSEVELPRTCNQLRMAADSAERQDWREPVIDRSHKLASQRESIGPVLVIGPNNFPLAFGSASGGDFAAALAAGNPVMAKAHPLHPATTALFAKLAQQALSESGLPAAMVQLFYHCDPQAGLALVANRKLGAVAFTGSRDTGLKLKAAADAAGIPIYLEMSSLNPVLIMKQALAQRATDIADALTDSCTMAAGQLCTKPGLVFVPHGDGYAQFVERAAEGFRQRPASPLFDRFAPERLNAQAQAMLDQGAELVATGEAGQRGFYAPHRLLRIGIQQFVAKPEVFQQEMFGNACLLVSYDNYAELESVFAALDGQLTVSLFAELAGDDGENYTRVSRWLVAKAGRVINDKMPTGVLVSAAMNHGGPFPATGHAGFSAVGLPGAAKRFSVLRCYDQIDESRLPPSLQIDSPCKGLWRHVDGEWQQVT